MLEEEKEHSTAEQGQGLKPILLLDIDGIKLPLAAAVAAAAADKDEDRSKLNIDADLDSASASDLRAGLDRDRGEAAGESIFRVQSLFGIFEVVWTTSWPGPGQTLVWLPIEPPLRFFRSSRGENNWAEQLDLSKQEATLKLGSVASWAQNLQRPLAWVDGEFGADARLWAEERSERTLLIRLDPSQLLPGSAHAELLEFATAVSSAGPD